MSTYNTNLAAEFWVLSMLHRLGADATLTLGNKKAVDIVIIGDGAGLKTVDVKGLQKRYDWPADNIRQSGPGDHFYVFLTFDGKIQDPGHAPSVWMVRPMTSSDSSSATIPAQWSRELLLSETEPGTSKLGPCCSAGARPDTPPELTGLHRRGRTLESLGRKKPGRNHNKCHQY